MKTQIRLATLALALVAMRTGDAQDSAIPATLAESVGVTLRLVEGQLLSVAEAMPESRYGWVPDRGNFAGVRSFAEQVKHAACGQFAFFNQIEGKTPPARCDKGGPDPARTKAELLRYLRDSFEYGNRVLAGIDAGNAQTRVDGPYAGPNTRIGMAVTAVWHLSDHYGQLVVYLRMNGVAPPPAKRYPPVAR